jgi:tyrosyl-tRNA synthetase
VDRFHGEGEGIKAEAAFNRVFVDHQVPEEIATFELDGTGPVHMPAAISDAFGVSRSEARRILQQGGVRRDGQVLPAETLDYDPEDLQGTVIQLGKRRFMRFESQS